MWRLYQRAIHEVSRQRANWGAAQKARSRRGKTNSQYELALEKSRIFNRKDYDIKLPRENDEHVQTVWPSRRRLSSATYPSISLMHRSKADNGRYNAT